MKLDERFKVLPFCCFGTDKKAITNHIGKKGYFANLISSFRDIRFCQYGTLGSVLGDQQESFCMNESGATFSFFIPEYFVKPKEKQYRPCTLDDFGLNIGDLIRFRRKDDHNSEICTMYTGYVRYKGIVKVQLGAGYYAFEELFNDYEWFDKDSNTWEMFGVEE